MKLYSKLAALLAVAVLAGCQKDESNEYGVVEGNETKVEIRLVNAADSKAPSGSEDGETYENEIKVVEVYVFKADGTPDEKVGDSSTGIGYYVDDAPSGNSNTIIVSSGTNKTFVAVTNMKLGPLATGETYNDLKAKIAKGEFKATAGGSDHNARDTRTNTGFEMMGERTGQTIDEGKEGQRVNITIDRLVSKTYAPTFDASLGIDITDKDIEKVWGDNSGVTLADLSFEFNGFALVNGMNKSHLYFIGNANGNDIDTPWSISYDDFTVGGKASLTSSFNSNGFYTNNYSGYGSADWFLPTTNTEAIYFYENKPELITENNQTGYNPKTVYGMMIKGTLKVAGQPNLDAVRYWRLNLIRTDDYHVLRNCVYRLNVKNITSPGEGTPEEAEKPIVVPRDETSVDVEITVNKWRVNFYDYEM